MDTYEATKTVMSRIQNLDPENSSKIMGYILIQDQGEKEMIRLAFSPDALLLSYINQAKTHLGLYPNTPSSTNPFPQTSPRIIIPNNNNNNGFHLSRQASMNNSSLSPRLHFYGDNEYHHLPLVDPIVSPGGRSDSLVFPYGEDAVSPHSHPFHKRSCSVNDAAFLSNVEDGFGWRPCMYFSSGFCKNGGECKFVHSGEFEGGDVGSPSKSVGVNVCGFDDFLRMKALQQQRFAAMAGGGGGGGQHPFAFNKCMDSLSENLRFQHERNDLSPVGFGGGGSSSSARQIYLTFPADSTFKEEDVSSYFGMFGPVQDVRIPFQQKRMFGFVTFVYPETVKLILAKGNPHFVCDSRVLVKPYKEKGKFKEKKQQCLSPSGVDSGEPFDMPFGSRMLLSPRAMMLRRKLEQEAELHAIELQGRRMMNLQLMDPKNENHNYHYPQSFPSGIPYSSPRQSQFLMNQHVTNSSDFINQEDPQEFDGGRDLATGADESFANNNVNGGNQLHRGNSDDSDLHESLEHILPDNLFSSPTKSAAENKCVFSQSSSEVNDGVKVSSSSNDPLLSGSSPLTIASLKSCYLQMPRFASGQEAVEM